MNGTRIIILCVYVLIKSDLVWSMELPNKELVSCDQHMALFSYSLSNLSQELITLQSEHQRNPRMTINPDRMRPTLAKLEDMQKSMLQLRASLKPEISAELSGDTTDVLREVQSVFTHVDMRLKNAHDEFKKYSATSPHKRQLVLAQTMTPITEIQMRLNDLFGICNNNPYQANRDDVFTVLLNKAFSSPLDTISGIAKSLAEKRILIPSVSDEFSRLDDTQQQTKWYDEARAIGTQYKSLYDELRAHMVIDLVADNADNIDYVLSDLSYRLCETKTQTQLYNNMQNVLDAVAAICSFFCTLKPVLEGMKDEEALDAKVMAEMLDAAQPRLIPRDKTLKLLEVMLSDENGESSVSGRVKRAFSRAVKSGITQTNLATEKQLDSLTRNAKRGHPHSKYIGNIRKFTEKYHLASLLPPVIAMLKHNNGTLTPMIQNWAEIVIAWGDDCQRIKDIIGELQKEHQQGGEIRTARERNSILLAYINRLKHAWDNPDHFLRSDCSSLTAAYYHSLQEQVYAIQKERDPEYDPDELEDYYYYKSLHQDKTVDGKINVVGLTKYGVSLMWIDPKEDYIRHRIWKWEQLVQPKNEEREREQKQREKALDAILLDKHKEEIDTEDQMVNQQPESVITPEAHHRRTSMGSAGSLRQALDAAGSSGAVRDSKSAARDKSKRKSSHAETPKSDYRHTNFSSATQRHSEDRVTELARLFSAMDDSKLEALLRILVLLDDSVEGGDLSDLAFSESL